MIFFFLYRILNIDFFSCSEKIVKDLNDKKQ